MEKMSIAYNLISRTIKEEPERYGEAEPMQGIYISIDPSRDSPTDVHEYCQEFNKNFEGLGGTKEQVEHCAKQFRIYYCKAPVDEKFPNDYLIDHSIIIYLISPDGELHQHFFKEKSAVEISHAIER